MSMEWRASVLVRKNIHELIERILHEESPYTPGFVCERIFDLDPGLLHPLAHVRQFHGIAQEMKILFAELLIRAAQAH